MDTRCGTLAGARWHYRQKQQPCPPCLKAAADYQRRRRAKAAPKPVKQRPCGTTAAYQRHIREGEPPCGPCVKASNARSRRAYQQRKAPPVCGTVRASNAHRKKGEQCDRCDDADQQRRAARFRREMRQLSECGTFEGYLAHDRRGDQVCAPCRVARGRWLRATKAGVAYADVVIPDLQDFRWIEELTSKHPSRVQWNPQPEVEQLDPVLT